MKKLPTLQETRDRLGSSRELFYVVLYKAVLASRDTISKGLCPFTPNLFAHCARAKLRELLELTPDVVVENVSNDGVIFTLKGMRFWCLKAQDGEVPAPGKSENRVDFCQQYGRSLPTQLVLLDETYAPQPIEVPKVELNLVLLWDYTDLRDLAFVHIVCPRDANATEVFREWTDIINKPIALDNDFAEPQPELIEHEDLTFTLRAETAKKNLTRRQDD
jgi:hypothetical protein